MRLAGHLHKTLAEIDRMDSREFSMWLAWARWFQPLDDPWAQTGLLASAVLAPHCPRGKSPSPDDFLPDPDQAPKHWTQIRDTLKRLKEDLDG